MSRDDAFRLTLRAMLEELESHRLEVCLAPAPTPMHSGHMVRVRCDINPRWYRDFCATFSSGRGWRRGKADTVIRRQHTARALRAMLGGRMPPAYGPRLLDAARRYWRTHRVQLLDLHRYETQTA